MSGFDVAADDALVVRDGERLAHLRDDVHCAGDGEAAALVEVDVGAFELAYDAVAVLEERPDQWVVGG